MQNHLLVQELSDSSGVSKRADFENLSILFQQHSACSITKWTWFWCNLHLCEIISELFIQNIKFHTNSFSDLTIITDPRKFHVWLIYLAIVLLILLHTDITIIDILIIYYFNRIVLLNISLLRFFSTGMEGSLLFEHISYTCLASNILVHRVNEFNLL